MTSGVSFVDRLGRSFTGGGEPAGSCPSPEQLWDAFHAVIGAPARAATVDHLATCAACAADWDLLHDVAVPVSATPPLRRTWGPALLSAAAFLLAIVITADVLRGPASPPAERTGGELEFRSFELGAPLPRSHALLRWTDLGPGTRYTVDVTTESLELLATARGLERPEYVVPPAVLARLPARATIVWRVEAALPDGHRAVSPGFRTRLE